MAQFTSQTPVNNQAVTSITLVGFEKNSFEDKQTKKVNTYFRAYAIYPLQSSGERRFSGAYACQLTLAEDAYDYLNHNIDELPVDLINVEMVEYTSFGKKQIRLQSFEIKED